jgi:hypothetical protein
MGALHAWREYRRFHHLPAQERNVAFYVESGQDWHHMEPLVRGLTEQHGLPIAYVTSDPSDPARDAGIPGMTCFWLPAGFVRILFFQSLRCDVLVLTMMDLDCFELRRSIHPVHYVYVFHSLGSTHMVDRARSYDGYDTILCAGPHQKREIRRREEQERLPAKELVHHGYARIEQLLALRTAPRDATDAATVLIAPTWGEHTILPECGLALVGVLLAAGLRVIVRPHHETQKRMPGVIDAISERYARHPDFTCVRAMGETDSLVQSDVLISDWSAMAIEYALGLEKPVLFVDVPPRVRNPSWSKLGLEPVERSIRTQVGAILDPGQIEKAADAVRALLGDQPRWLERVASLRDRHVFNLGTCARAGSAAIARIASRQRGRGTGGSDAL